MRYFSKRESLLKFNCDLTSMVTVPWCTNPIQCTYKWAVYPPSPLSRPYLIATNQDLHVIGITRHVAMGDSVVHGDVIVPMVRGVDHCDVGVEVSDDGGWGDVKLREGQEDAVVWRQLDHPLTVRHRLRARPDLTALAVQMTPAFIWTGQNRCTAHCVDR